MLFTRPNLETFDISHAFLPLTVTKLSTVKNSLLKTVCFGPPCTSKENNLTLDG